MIARRRGGRVVFAVVEDDLEHPVGPGEVGLGQPGDAVAVAD
jgi:hypothetical protein